MTHVFFQLQKYDTMTPEQFKEKSKKEKEPEELVVKGDAPKSTIAPPTPWTNEPIATKHNTKVYKNNGKKFVILQKNETIFQISRRFGIPMWKLYACNDFKAGQDLKEGTLTFHSLNPSPEYHDFTLREDDIRALYYVIKKKPKEVGY